MKHDLDWSKADALADGGWRGGSWHIDTRGDHEGNILA